MESDFERAAKRAVVDAVERRLDHNDRVRRRAALRRRLSSIGSVVVGLAVLTGIVMWSRGGGGISGIREQIGALFGKSQLAAVIGGKTEGAEDGASESGARARYTILAQKFLAGELKSWKCAPEGIKPKRATDGAVYHALVPRKVGFTIYEMEKLANGRITVCECSPFGAPLKIDGDVFRRNLSSKRYFIAHDGVVYASGSEDLAKMDSLRRILLKEKENTNSTDEILP